MLTLRVALVVFLVAAWGGHGFSRADELQPQTPALAAEGNARSEAELEQLVRAQPEKWELHVELIEASAAGRLPERTRWYQAWLTAEQSAAPANSRRRAAVHAALGTCYWRAGDLRGARSEYRQAVRLEPENRAFTEALRTLEAQTGWHLRDTLIVLLFVLLIVAYVALRRRRWMRVLRG